jgi:uridine kinase
MMNEYNFDCPDAFDVGCLIHTLKRLKEGKSVDIPVYNFATHRVEKHKVI